MSAPEDAAPSVAGAGAGAGAGVGAADQVADQIDVGEPKRNSGSTRLRCGELEIMGSSVAGKGTCVCVPSLGIAFDMGLLISHGHKQNTVCITHGHTDHIGASPSHARVNALGPGKQCKVTYYVPPVCRDPLERMFKAAHELDGNPDQPLPTIVTVDSCDPISLGKSLLVPFPTRHRVPSVGYAVVSTVRKLRDEFFHLAGDTGVPVPNGPAIQEARMAGIDVNRSVDVITVAYTGDTTLDAVLDSTVALSAKVLIMECTFIGSKTTIDFAREKGHVHLDEIAAAQAQFQNEHIVLTHFSMRYSRGEILDAVDAASFSKEFRGKLHLLLGGHN